MRKLGQLKMKISKLNNDIEKTVFNLSQIMKKREILIRKKIILENRRNKTEKITQELKDIDIHITELNLKKTLFDKEKEILIKRRTALQNRFNKYSNIDRKITDHAIVRYMERIMGINIEDLEDQILNDSNAIKIKQDNTEIIVTIRSKDKK